MVKINWHQQAYCALIKKKNLISQLISNYKLFFILYGFSMKICMKLEFCSWLQMLRVSNMLGHFLIFNSFLQNLATYQKCVEGQRATGRRYSTGILRMEELQQEARHSTWVLLISWASPWTTDISFDKLIDKCLRKDHTAFPPQNGGQHCHTCIQLEWRRPSG